ncbi:MAG: phosphonoacetaldehyde reductase [Candidatus Marinimicrobia bacterium]|nr:phosphonoacetaldehyde reductase [Candidatus Neomarinimicrobiota bacterium]
MAARTYHNPVEVLASDDWLGSCREQLERLAVRTPLVVTSPGGRLRWHVDAHFPAGQIYDQVAPNPTLVSCQQAAVFALEGNFDGVVALGGGSVMDTAKCMLAALGTGNGQVAELLELEAPYPHRLPAVFIPTTHGTASEVTMWGTVWDFETQRKYSLSHPDLYPDAAILDPRLTLNLPLDVSMTTTLDALSHSFESIWNRHALPESTDHAIKAITAILSYAPALKERPGDLDVRRHLLAAATTAGLAFSNTLTAAAHAISYPLTMRFGVPHGIASSLALLPLLAINGPTIAPALERLYETLNLSGMEELRERIGELPEGVLAYHLRDWGVRRNQLDGLTEQCFTGRMDNNVVDLTREQVRGILEELF